MTWPGEDNVDEYTWMDELGNIHLRSIEDDMSSIVLSSNCLHVRVNFLYLLPKKKAEWTVNAIGMANDEVDDRVSESRSHIS